MALARAAFRARFPFPGQAPPSRWDYVDLPLIAAGCVFAAAFAYGLAGGRLPARRPARFPLRRYLVALASLLALAAVALAVYFASR